MFQFFQNSDGRDMSELVKGKRKKENTIEINVFLICIKSLYVAY